MGKPKTCLTCLPGPHPHPPTHTEPSTDWMDWVGEMAVLLEGERKGSP